MFPVYREFIEKNFEEGYHEPDKNWVNSSFNCAHRVKFDLFQKYGYIAAAGDRHLAEFMPGDVYLKSPEIVSFWKFGLTTVDWRKNDLQKRLAKSKRLTSGEEDVELKPSGEEGILLIKALCGLERVVSNVNIPNTNKQITNLSETAVVETNALFERDSIRPIVAGELPDDILKLILPHVQNHEDILEASLTHNKNLAFKAFMNDPLIKGKVSEKEGKILLDDMIRNTLFYLSSEWNN